MLGPLEPNVRAFGYGLSSGESSVMEGASGEALPYGSGHGGGSLHQGVRLRHNLVVRGLYCINIPLSESKTLC